MTTQLPTPNELTILTNDIRKDNDAKSLEFNKSLKDKILSYDYTLVYIIVVACIGLIILFIFAFVMNSYDKRQASDKQQSQTEDNKELYIAESEDKESKDPFEKVNPKPEIKYEESVELTNENAA